MTGRTFAWNSTGVAVLAGLALTPAGLNAAPRNPAVLQKIADCRTVVGDAARLACYDAAAAALGEATARQDIVVLDREAVRETRKGLFGFSLPKLPFFGGDRADKAGKEEAAREEITEIDGVAALVRSVGYHQFRIILEDGAVWTTTEASTLDTPHVGSKIHIKRAALGSYLLKIDGGRALKALRAG